MKRLGAGGAGEDGGNGETIGTSFVGAGFTPNGKVVTLISLNPPR
ncbi:hypothetical protein [Coleofasciculus sp. G2-EDA-02]